MADFNEGGASQDKRYPKVTVTEISLEHAKAPRKDLDLGSQTNAQRDIERKVSDAMQGLQRAAKKAYKLDWEGNKVPRGTVVGGHMIAWTQNGQVISDEGQTIGTYERLVEFGGESGNKQEMLVFLNDVKSEGAE